MSLTREEKPATNSQHEEEIVLNEPLRLTNIEKNQILSMIHSAHADHLLSELVNYHRHHPKTVVGFEDLCSLVPSFQADYQSLSIFDQIKDLKQKKDLIQSLFSEYSREILSGLKFVDTDNLKTLIKQAKSAFGLTELQHIYHAIKLSNDYPTPLQLPDGLNEEMQCNIRALDLFMHLSQESKELVLIKNIVVNIHNMDTLFNLFTEDYLANHEQKATNKNTQSTFFTTDQASNKNTAYEKKPSFSDPIDVFKQFFGDAFGAGQFPIPSPANKSSNNAKGPAFSDIFNSSYNMPDKINQYKKILAQHNKKVIDTNKNSNCDVFYHIANDSSDNVILSAINNTHANLSTQDQYGNTALHLAALCGRMQLVEILLSHSADINNQNHSGNTPLHLAISSHHKEVVRLLMKHDANTHIKNKHGHDQTSLAINDSDSDYAAILNQTTRFKPV